MTNIEWTKNPDGSKGVSWNPITGCSRKSSGCEKCYAEKMTKRLENIGVEQYQGLLTKEGRFNGNINFAKGALLKPLKRKKPTTWFVNSMSDLFHPNVPDEEIDKVFAVIALSPQHTFQILTKRPERMRDYFNTLDNENIYQDRWSDPVLDFGLTRTGLADDDDADAVSCDVFNYLDENFPLPNVWLGVSTENQDTADERIPLLLETPAAIRWVSAEPLLSKIDFNLRSDESITTYNVLSGLFSGNDGAPGETLDWVVVGGESGGAKARPFYLEQGLDIIQQCQRADVPVFFKQAGSYCVVADALTRFKYPDGTKIEFDLDQTTLARILLKNGKGADLAELPKEFNVREFPRL